ncbi:unnamed protein product [Aphanomyces euteiches]|nr:hypothetical protein AeRB84_004978 [Aphanomyces euteiches]
MSSSKVLSIPSLCHVSVTASETATASAIPHLRVSMHHNHDLKKRELVKKVTSVRKGLIHVQECQDHHCDKALCKSTRRLIDQYRTHGCVNSNSALVHDKCQVCLLWTLVTGNASIAV